MIIANSIGAALVAIVLACKLRGLRGGPNRESASHYCMTQAMRFADATVIPMGLLRVRLSAAANWLACAERLDSSMSVGRL
jgi:hypothetical protein